MRELVSATFVAGWREAQPDVDFALENELGRLPPTGLARFALLTIIMTTAGATTQGARGTRRVQRNGVIQVKLWSPPDTGAAGAAALADSVREILEMIDMPLAAGTEPVTTQAAATMPIGEDGAWYMTLVRVPFWYVETK